MNQYSKIIVYFITAVFLTSCALGSGSVIVTGTVRPATDPQSVKLYLKEPKRYEVIGLVEASSVPGWSEQQAKDHAIEILKNKASKVGANGVLLTAIGDQTVMMYGGYGPGSIWTAPVTAEVVKGTAIFVYEE